MPAKICKFLFPILSAKGLNNSIENLKEIMPMIKNKKDESGLYDLRSKIVHEGHSITEKEAKLTIEKVVPRFFDILNSLLVK